MWLRSCCKNCSDKAADDCKGCIVGLHLCSNPPESCLKEDREELT